MKLILQRAPFGAVNTKGQLSMVSDDGAEQFYCDTLELAWRDNEKEVSCVSCGTYSITPYKSIRLGRCFLVSDVPGREAILIHAGNYASSDEEYKSDIQGCILVGAGYSDINNDGIAEILNSRMTLNGLVTMLTKPTYQLEIRNAQ